MADWDRTVPEASDSGVNLNFCTAIPKATKESGATQQFRRAISLSSNERMEEKSAAKISNLLANNAYPPEVISESFRRAKKTRTRKEDGEMPPAAVLCLQFCSDELHGNVASLCKKSGLPVKIVYKKSKNLNNILAGQGI